MKLHKLLTLTLAFACILIASTQVQAQHKKNLTSGKYFVEAPSEEAAADSLNEYLKEHVIKPQMAVKTRTSGKAVVHARVGDDGKIISTRIIMNPGMGCGKALDDVVREMVFKNLPYGATDVQIEYYF